MTKLPDYQVEDMLRQLSEHFGEPVMPLKAFCFTMRQWVECIEQGVQDQKTENDGLGRGGSNHQHGQEYVQYLRHILIDIAKSSLLGRLFYGREQVRTVKCPEHKGHWVGLESDRNFCQHGCGFTGWLPNE